MVTWLKNLFRDPAPPPTPAALAGVPEVHWRSKDDAKNPFTVDGYDCLSFVRGMRSTTSDPHVTTNFVATRNSVGSHHIGKFPEGATVIEHRLEYSSGETSDGVLFKAQKMEQKWDIYLYRSKLYFCRSWTDTLVFVAEFSAASGRLTIDSLWAPEVEGGRDHAVRQVDYLIKSHLFRRAVPHPLPQTLLEDPNTVGLYSFSQYGNQCCFGTYDDTLRGDLAKPKSGV